MAVHGDLFRVGFIQPGGPGGVACKVLLRADRPKGIPVRRDSYVVPLAKAGRGSGCLHEYPIVVESITVLAGEPPAAKVAVWLPWAKGIRPKAYAAVRADDVLLINGKGHAVRSVVPADTKTRVIGWLELSPDPVWETDLVSKKVPFVRPAEPER